jgi:glycosyltransferase involved in cell wall biosynthesis
LKITFEFLKLYKRLFNIEIIIVDGGSTDGTKQFLESNDEIIDSWVSEKDNGIGDAWNKGFNLSSGEVINYLSAGDRHQPELVLDNINHFKDATHGITYANTVIEKNGAIVRFLNGDVNSHSIYRGFGFCHPTCFFTRNVFESIGKFDPSISIAVDTDWLLRAKVKGVPFTKIEGITLMDGTGVSNKNRYKAKSQYLDALVRNGFSKFICEFYNVAYCIKKWFFSR